MLISIVSPDHEGTIDGVNVLWGVGETVSEQAIGLSIEYAGDECTVLVGRSIDEED